MNSFSNLRSMINILLVLFSKGMLSDALEGVTSKTFSLAPLASSEPSYSFYHQKLSYLGTYIFVLVACSVQAELGQMTATVYYNVNSVALDSKLLILQNTFT